jgi:hypothetical protein
MNLKTTKKMKLLNVERKKSLKTGNDFELINLADVEKFESYQFYKGDNVTIAQNVNSGDMVDVTFSLSKNGYNNNLNILSIEK